MSARGRLVAVLALIAAAGLVLAGGTLPWATVTVAGQPPITLTGARAAPALAPLALATAALGVALTLARGRVAQVLGVVGILLQAITVIYLMQRIGERARAIADAASEAAGVTTADAASSTTAVPVVAVVGIALAVAASILVVVKAPSWRTRQATRRYERADSGLAWDAIDEGVDPTVDR